MAHPEFHVSRSVQLCEHHTLSSIGYGTSCSEFSSYRRWPCVSRQAKRDGCHTRVECPARHDGSHEHGPHFSYTRGAPDAHASTEGYFSDAHGNAHARVGTDAHANTHGNAHAHATSDAHANTHAHATSDAHAHAGGGSCDALTSIFPLKTECIFEF